MNRFKHSIDRFGLGDFITYRSINWNQTNIAMHHEKHGIPEVEMCVWRNRTFGRQMKDQILF